MKASQELVEFVTELKNEADAVLKTAHELAGGHYYVEAGAFQGLLAGCRLLVEKLGPFGKVWDKMLPTARSSEAKECQKVRSVLQTISNALRNGRLRTVDELVSAEVLGDLVEHAEILLKMKYYLPAAVILRAVLEERLRKMCESGGCMPAVQKPTIQAFKQALYSAQIIDKIVVKDIDWMAGIGNAAAHQLPEFDEKNVPSLYGRVTAFLTRFSSI